MAPKKKTKKEVGNDDEVARKTIDEEEVVLKGVAEEVITDLNVFVVCEFCFIFLLGIWFLLKMIFSSFAERGEKY